jgi:hypothetical protein
MSSKYLIKKKKIKFTQKNKKAIVESSSESKSDSDNDDDRESIMYSLGELEGIDLDEANLSRLIKDDAITSFDPTCVRKRSNLSKTSPEYKFDTPIFSPEKLLNDIKVRSPKLDALLSKIQELDMADMRKHGTLFKHFIFSDIKSSSFGSKLIASALIAKGMTLGYKATLKANGKSYSKIELSSDAELAKTAGRNFYLLSSVGVYNQPITVALKKAMLRNFNRRPENIHGDYARIAILDSGFKEGIDLFDVKYVHIFEPQTTPADQKQVIGRGTRTCGQKGLEFHPTRGWPLNVYIYDVAIPEQVRSMLLDSDTAFGLYMKAMNLDLRLFNFNYDLERATILGSVDYELNKAIHEFAINKHEMDSEEDDDSTYGGGPKKRKIVIVGEDSELLPNPLPLTKPKRKIVINDYVDPNAVNVLATVLPQALPKRMNHQELRVLVAEQYDRFKWTDVHMENLCSEPKGKKRTGGAELIKYSPSQDFIRHYFTPENPVKGMLLFQSVGTGKTCSAIAAASSTFEPLGYTILWVTRTTLKNDIWKNMFEQICNESIRYQIEQGAVIPQEHTKRMRLLSKSWKIRPISYKQFSNLVSKQNQYYKTLVKINGEEDPLRKTLLIIDEAHKLYGGGDLSSLERPDMAALKAALMNSYRVSGPESVKLLLMTATPITQNPMELIQLINLCKPADEQMPDTFDRFASNYLDEMGHFTGPGQNRYLDDIAGYVSYLNREKDARQFAQPILNFVTPPIFENPEDLMKYDKKYVREFMEGDTIKLKEKIAETAKKIEGELSDIDAGRFEFLKKKCNDFEDKKDQKKCNGIVREHIRELLASAKAASKTVREEIKAIREEIKNKNLFKKQKMGEIAESFASSPEDFERYKESMFYNIKNMCGKKIRSNVALKEVAATHPVIRKTDAELALIDKTIQDLTDGLASSVGAYKQRMKDLKALLKTDLSDLERSVVKMTIKTEQKTQRKKNSMSKKMVSEQIVVWNKARKITERKKNKAINKIRKTMREKLSELKMEERENKRVETKLRRTVRKQEKIREDFKDEALNALIKESEDKIDKDLEELQDELIEEQIAKEAKEAEKTKTKAAKEAEKTKAKEAKAVERVLVKEAKEADKKEKAATKKHQKELEKEHKRTVKAQEKLAKAEHKRTVKAQEKLEKKQNKSDKK